MDINRCITVSSGLAVSFISYGVMRVYILKSENIDKCSRFNLILGLNSAITSGLLQVYTGIRH
jgi:hypothetical protein